MNKQQFEQLQQLLYQQHFKSVNNDCTYAPIYYVRTKRIDWGYEEDYAEEHQLMFLDCDGVGFSSVQEFVDYYEDDEWEEEFCDTDYPTKEEFLLCHDDLNDVENTMCQLQPNNGWEILHGNSRWERKNVFITYDAAVEFLIGKGYTEDKIKLSKDVSIEIDSLYRSNEFRKLLEAVAKGEVVYKEDIN